jgi:hypothetical protein
MEYFVARIAHQMNSTTLLWMILTCYDAPRGSSHNVVIILKIAISQMVSMITVAMIPEGKI